MLTDSASLSARMRLNLLAEDYSRPLKLLIRAPECVAHARQPRSRHFWAISGFVFIVKTCADAAASDLLAEPRNQALTRDPQSIPVLPCDDHWLPILACDFVCGHMKW